MHGHVTDDVAAFGVHPHRRHFRARRIGDEEQRVTGMEAAHDVHSAREHGAMHIGSKPFLTWRWDGHSYMM